MRTSTPAVPFVYNVDRVIKVKDGDTISLVVDLGFDTLRRVDVRISGFDAPEMRSKDDAERRAARVSLRAFEDWVSDYFDLGIAVESHKLDPVDKYGRIIGDLVCPRSVTSPRLTTFLFNGGYVRPYDGGARLPWLPAELSRIHNSPIGCGLLDETSTDIRPTK